MMYKLISPFLISLLLLVLTGCSTTKSIPDDDQLFIGLEGIKYNAPERGEHYDATVEELEAALATAPNGSLFGSSVRSPFPVGLWAWNEFQDAEDGIGKWIYNSFATQPVLMSWINPSLRASVAKEVLRAHGYFRGNVEHQELTMKNPKKAKIAYTVNMGHLFTIDSLSYEHFTPLADSLIHSSLAEASLHDGDAFDVSTLESERARINTLLRNNGFYYYQPSYASYLADTTSVRGKVLLKFQQMDNLPTVATRQWRIGKVDIDLKKNYMEQLTDSLGRRSIVTHYAGGRRPPVRRSVLMNALKLRPGELYSYTNHEETLNRLSAAGLFSVVDFAFTPRDTTGLNDTLDLRLNCVLDRPYDFYVEANVTGKTSNRFGPGVVVGLTKRNAFRGGELLDINLKGSYEWQTGHKNEGSSTGFESYEYGADVSLQYPRIMVPFFDKLRRRLNMRRRHSNYFSTPSTTYKFSSDIISRANSFKRHIISGEWTYVLQPSPTERHQFSPLVLSYEYMRSTTDAFDSLVYANPYLLYTMADRFVPKMQYIYTYTSPSTKRNPIWWQTTIAEGANLLSLGYMAAGKKWGERDKKMFGNPYAQFLKLETELVKTWTLSERNSIVGHVDAGVIWSYGNSSVAPYSEQFYVGGANSIRAFNARYIGPGAYDSILSSHLYNLDRTGDIRLLMNLEYRPHLFGSLYGAAFIDAGNVWQMHSDGIDDAKFRLKSMLKQMALGTGIGLRYDLEFLVIRVDWGVALHLPYKSGFYNIDRFRDGQTLHFAVGYPF